MRLIDADKLLHDIAVRKPLYRTDIEKLIKDAEAADAVQVVRCKDCKYGEVVIKHGMGFCTNACGVRGAINTEDYCSFGERKEP